MTKLQWVVVAVIFGLGVWNAWEGEWLWAGADWAVTVVAVVLYRFTNRRRVTVDVTVEDKIPTPETIVTEPFGFEDSDAWKTHLANCAECRDFWKKDGQ